MIQSSHSQSHPPHLGRRAVLAAAIAGAVGVAAGRPITAAAQPVDHSTSGLRALRRSFGRDFPYLNRGGWGADESYRFAPDGTEILPPAYYDVQTLTVHHTVTSNNDADPAATVRAIYFDMAVKKDFGDMGYHLLIDQQGTVYEGRYSGNDSVPVFGPRRVGPRPSVVTAAHVGQMNSGNVGVALLGDLTSTQPTAAARDSLVKVLAALATATRLDPLGTTNYVNPVSGATRTVSTIAGHRDWGATECPGNSFYPVLAQVRQDVAALMNP